MKNFNLDALRAVAAAGVCLYAALPAGAAADLVRQLQYTVTVDAQQTWKNPDHGQWSKATSRQRYEMSTQFKSDGKLEVRNFNDLDLNARLEAKVIFLARRAKQQLERSGKSIKIPKTEEEKSELSNGMQEEMYKCNGDQACTSNVMSRYTAIFAAMQYPEAMQDDTVPGTFLYFLPFPGCADKAHVTIEMQIDGQRWNKTSDRLVPFSERHSADSTSTSDDKLPLCQHMNAVLDTADKVKSLYLDNVWVPTPTGTTSYTESGEARPAKQERQPMPTEVLDWMASVLRHAPPNGSAHANIALPLPLNANATTLGLWQGVAKVDFQWSFTEQPVAATQTK